jgi:energy-coupling factor transporter transmembrane protein EcfT
MHNCMDIQQIAPWVSLVASLCSLVYVGIQIRNPSGDDSETDRERRGFGDVVAQSQIFLVIAASMLLFAGAVHYVLWLFSVPAFAGPVWMVAAFVIVFIEMQEKTNPFRGWMNPYAIEPIHRQTLGRLPNDFVSIPVHITYGRAAYCPGQTRRGQ